MLYIMCGHGEGDPGATYGQATEADLVRKIGKKMYEVAAEGYVELFNPMLDHYRHGTLSTFKPKHENDMIIELHMDSYPFNGNDAKGGHVIIHETFEPDEYDRNIARLLEKYLPGRAEVIVKRGDLFNCNVCAQRGLNYRLVECGFITNNHDREFVEKNVLLLAGLLLKCFEIPLKPIAQPKEKRREVEIDKWYELTPNLRFHVDKVEGVV